MEDRWGIQIVPDDLEGARAALYRASVQRVLATIARTQSGQALLNSIRHWRNSSDVGILPYPNNGCNAITTSNEAEHRMVTVQFSPESQGRRRGCKGAGDTADAVLYHELVHALRRASRKNAKRDLEGTMGRYYNNESFTPWWRRTSIFPSSGSRCARRITA